MSLNALAAIKDSDAKFKKWIRHHVPPLSSGGSSTDTTDDSAALTAGLAAFTGSTNIVTLGNLPSVGIGVAPPAVANGTPRLLVRGSTALSPVARFQTSTLTNPFLEMWAQSGLSWLGGDSGGAGTQSIYFDNSGNTGLAGTIIGLGSALSVGDYATFSGSQVNILPPVQITNTLHTTGGVTIDTITHETTNVNTFLVSNAGLVKYRTGAEILVDIGATGSASPSFTGTPTAPTAPIGTNTTQIATTAFVLANRSSSGAILAMSKGFAVTY